ncbi:MAG TPA: MOSC domain-containing protein [Syntrophales bacterium]|jgi:MOSC domain-containing protein YiiM|nr:MOSC domain-containing protein [Syntrophales bacterium]HQA82127.1 MOSC domain-containing protein [Syntrophales bacterium]
MACSKQGRVLSVNISNKKGEKKHDIGRSILVEQSGLSGDAHAGFQHRQVSLLSEASIRKIRDKGLDVQFGDFAENLTISGIELFTLPLGTRLKVGNDVLLEITQIGKVCHERCHIFHQVGDCVMPREGVFAAVIKGGDVQVGDEVEVMG